MTADDGAFGDMMGAHVTPKDVFLAFTMDEGGNVVNACKLLGVEVLKCNAHRLNSTTMWALGVNGSVPTCENPDMEKLIKRLAALVGYGVTPRSTTTSSRPSREYKRNSSKSTSSSGATTRGELKLDI